MHAIHAYWAISALTRGALLIVCHVDWVIILALQVSNASKSNLARIQHALPEQVEVRPAIHLAFDQFEAIHLSFQ